MKLPKIEVKSWKELSWWIKFRLWFIKPTFNFSEGLEGKTFFTVTKKLGKITYVVDCGEESEKKEL